MRTLILGGTRFIGLHLVYELLRRGHQVTILNRGQTKADLPPEVERLYADRSDPASVKSALAGRDFDAAFDISAYIPAQLAPAVEALEGRVGHYVYISSIAVYEPTETFPIPETHPLMTEWGGQWPDYGWGKVECESYLRERWRKRGFPFTAFRPVMVYGPDNHNSAPYWELAHFARLRRGRPILIPSDGSRIMQFVHVDDLARAFASALQTGASLGQAYNMAGPEAVTMAGYIRLLGRVAGVEPEIIFVDFANDEGVPSSFPFIWRRSAIYNIEKARKDLGFDPRPMIDGLEETYRWYLAQDLDDYPWDFSAEDALLGQIRS